MKIKKIEHEKTVRKIFGARAARRGEKYNKNTYIY